MIAPLRRLLAAAAVTALVWAHPAASLPAAVPSAVGATAGDVAAALRAAAPLERLADRTRADLTSGSLRRALERTGRLAGVRVPAATLSPPRDLPLPASLAAPVGQLLAAVEASVDGLARAHRSTGAQRRDLDAPAGIAALWGDLPPERRAELEQTRTAWHHDPVARAALEGAAGITEALDRVLPSLQAAATRIPPATVSTAEACDLLDARPWLCVTGAGATVYDVDAALIVDLGGDNLYVNAAGGANALLCGSADQILERPWCVTQVVVDLSGNNTYRPDPQGRTARVEDLDLFVAMGAAYQGVGILVDGAGDDDYDLRVGTRLQPLAPLAQGAAVQGVGILADLDGDDVYGVSGRAEDVAAVSAQGSALFGLGMLLDEGGTNEYRMRIDGVQPAEPAGSQTAVRRVTGQAAGLFGGAVLYDADGDATFEAVVDLVAGPQEATGRAEVVAQGVAVAGGAALVSGAGPTAYVATAQRSAATVVTGETPPGLRLPGSAAVAAQAVAGAHGIAVLDDRGGADTFSASARSDHRVRADAVDGCACERAVATLDASAAPGEPASARATVQAQGHTAGPSVAGAAGGSAPGAGQALLWNRAGDDVYEAHAEVVLAATANDLRDGGAVAASASAAWDGQPGLAAAFGQGSGAGGPAVLRDDAGEDRYVLRAEGLADAHARSGVDSFTGPSVGEAEAPAATVVGQGASSAVEGVGGVLVDRNDWDTYLAHAIARARTSPNPDRARDQARSACVQGSGGGVFFDFDRDRPDTIASGPHGETASGHRGEDDRWSGLCEGRPGVGLNAGGQLKPTTVALALDPFNPDGMGGGRVPFEAWLDGPFGGMAAEEVRFNVEYRPGLLPDEAWTTVHPGGHGFTNAAGSAVAWLDLDRVRAAIAAAGADPAQVDTRVTARWDGDPDHRHAQSSAPLDLGG